MSETYHAMLSPSSAHRWMTCVGSIALCKNQPDFPSEFAAEGTAAHEIAALCLNDGRDPSAFIGRVFEVDGFSIEVDDGMAEDIAKYVDTIRGYTVYGDLLVEQEVPIDHITGEKGATGTSDAVILAGEELMIADLKFGRGVQVDADNNPQLMLYALGALEQFGDFGDFKRVRMIIHQPRIGHLSEWACSVEELHAFGEVAKEAAERSMLYAEGSDTFPVTIHDLTVSDKGCRFCKAKAVCPALAAHVEATIAMDFDTIPLSTLGSAVHLLDAERLGEIYPALDLIDGWMKAVRGRIEHELLNGNAVPGLKLVQGRRGARKWSSTDEAEALLKSMRLKADEMYSFKVISPTQAEKLLAKESPRRWKKAEALIVQPNGSPSVAPESDKRPALVIAPVAEDFDVVDDGSDLC